MVRNSAINLMTKAIPPTMPIPNSTNLRWVIVTLASFFCKFRSLDYFQYILLYKRQKFIFYRKIGIFESIDIMNKTQNWPKKVMTGQIR